MQPIINALLDPVVNFGKVTVSTGYTSIDTTITLITGDGSKLPNPVSDGSFNLVWFNNSTYSDPADDPNVEIVRCIVRIGDTLTLMRAQEGTLASDKNIPTKIYKMVLSPTKKIIDDIQTESQSKVDTHSTLSTGVHGMGVDTIDGVSTRNIAISNHAGIVSNVHGFDVSGNAPAQTHGISRHTGTIGTWSSIDKTISSIADITTRSHTLLTDIGTNTHAIIDTAISNLTTHIGASIAHNVTSNIVGISDTQILSNKTLTSPFISTIYGSNVANGIITIEGTSNATKTSSYVILQPTLGNVGIGTTVPTAKLHIGGTPGTDGIKFPDGTLQTTATTAGGVSRQTFPAPITNEWTSEGYIDDNNSSTAATVSTIGVVGTRDIIYDLGSNKHVIVGIMYYGTPGYAPNSTLSFELAFSFDNISYFPAQTVGTPAYNNLSAAGYTRYIRFRHNNSYNVGGQIATSYIYEATLFF